MIAPSSNAADPRPRLSIHWSHQQAKWFICPRWRGASLRMWVERRRPGPETPSAFNHRGMNPGHSSNGSFASTWRGPRARPLYPRCLSQAAVAIGTPVT